MDTHMDNAVQQAAGVAGSRGDEDDAAVITRSLHHPESFGVVYDRHAPAIYRYVTQIGRAHV